MEEKAWGLGKKSYICKQKQGAMAETRNRRLPVGIQSFEEIREGEYLYVDKTDIVWQLANRGKKYNYLSRPRRFGKSVLVDTLEAYFPGKRELFEGLRIMELEREWVKRPVIRLDMSRAGAAPDTLRSYLGQCFRPPGEGVWHCAQAHRPTCRPLRRHYPNGT